MCAHMSKSGIPMSTAVIVNGVVALYNLVSHIVTTVAVDSELSVDRWPSNDYNMTIWV